MVPKVYLPSLLDSIVPPDFELGQIKLQSQMQSEKTSKHNEARAYCRGSEKHLVNSHDILCIVEIIILLVTLALSFTDCSNSRRSLDILEGRIFEDRHHVSSTRTSCSLLSSLFLVATRPIRSMRPYPLHPLEDVPAASSTFVSDEFPTVAALSPVSLPSTSGALTCVED